MSALCVVDGCDQQREAVFNLNPEGPFMSAGVCQFHLAALSAGEAYEVDRSSGSIRLGRSAPPEFIGCSFDSNVGSPELLTLHFGHDGIASSEITFRASQKFLDFVNAESTVALWSRQWGEPDTAPED